MNENLTDDGTVALTLIGESDLTGFNLLLKTKPVNSFNCIGLYSKLTEKKSIN